MGLRYELMAFRMRIPQKLFDLSVFTSIGPGLGTAYGGVCDFCSLGFMLSFIDWLH